MPAPLRGDPEGQFGIGFNAQFIAGQGGEQVGNGGVRVEFEIDCVGAEWLFELELDGAVARHDETRRHDRRLAPNVVAGQPVEADVANVVEANSNRVSEQTRGVRHACGRFEEIGFNGDPGLEGKLEGVGADLDIKLPAECAVRVGELEAVPGGINLVAVELEERRRGWSKETQGESLRR
jgi:hypothetical protein